MAASVLECGPIPLERTLYPEECLAAAMSAYVEFLAVKVIAEEERARTIQIEIHPACSSQASEVRKEFLNYLLDLAVQHYLKKGP
jgi:hypothetical protein